MAIRVSITNQELRGGPDVLAQVFHVDPVGHADSAPVDSRIIFPGITAVLRLRDDQVVTLQHAPELAPAASAALDD